MPEKKKGFDLAAALAPVSNLNTGGEGREQIQYIHVEHIRPDERNFYQLDGIDELAASIELVGLQQPLRVRPDPDHEGVYIIVSGHRRHAALKRLIGESQELYDRFSNAPCIVERQTDATDEVEAMLQELRLIYGNSDTRKMSSADLSKQAERVEMLLYQLKEAGVEFPGRMRDHVAQACKVSASKLARLKVIRENLIGDLKKSWEAGELNESAAYAFAQQKRDVQIALVQYMLGHSGVQRRLWHEGQVSYAAKTIKKELHPRKCSEVQGGSCNHTAARLQRLASSNNYIDHCHDGMCCHGCPSLGTCGHACPHLSDEVAKARKKAEADRAKEKEKKNREDERIVAPKARLWKRFAEARAAAGLTWEEYAKKADVVAFRREKKVEDFEQGRKLTPSSGGLPYTGGDGVNEWRIKPLVKAADALGCSVDYLLCRTDIREMAKEAPAKAPSQAACGGELLWIPPTECPKEGQVVALAFDFGAGGIHYQLGRWANGGWCFFNGAPIDRTPAGWFPLPDVEEVKS